MKIIWTANNQGYSRILEKLKIIEEQQAKNSRKKFISFPVIFKRVGEAFSCKKEEIWNKLYLLRDFGLIEIVPYHGIILLYTIIKTEEEEKKKLYS